MVKRFECVFVSDDEYGGHFRGLKDNTTSTIYLTCDTVDLLNFQDTTIKIMKEENEQLKEKLQSVTMLKDDYKELIESFEKKYGKNIEDVI